MAELRIRPFAAGDRQWALHLVCERWGSETVVTRGAVHRPAELPGFVAVRRGERIGLVTYNVDQDGCQIVSLDSVEQGIGVGTALIEATERWAWQQGCTRLWLVTTNDNVEALRFYQKRGFVLVELHRDAVEASRRLKPAIPTVGAHGIPIRDEIELEMILNREA